MSVTQATVTNTQVAVKYQWNVSSLLIDMSADNRTTTLGRHIDQHIGRVSVAISPYRPMLDRFVGRHIDRHISVDISTDTRPIRWPTYRLVAYPSTCRPTIGQPLSVDKSTNISVECRSTYRPMLDRCVGRYGDRHISVDISTDTRPIRWPTYRSTLGRYVDRYIGRVLTDTTVECRPIYRSRGAQNTHDPKNLSTVHANSFNHSRAQRHWI